MSEPILPIHPEDIHLSHTKRVVCNGISEGEGGAHGFGRHPQVVLTMVDDAQGNPSHVTCPYCSRIFKYQYAPQVAAHHSDE